MVELQIASRRRVRRPILTSLVLLAGTILSQPAFARHHHHSHHGRIVLAHAVGRSHPTHVRPGSYTPPFSVYAVDGNSGRVLYQKDENALRHPASITKVMTLYLLFEQLEKHHLTLDSELEVSQHAASQEPTKLGLRPGSHIRVEDAIKAIVTKSANDMAVTIAERLGGDEHTFAQMMTRKAHSLGMSRSNFVNASGLPDDMQLTTAHDLVILGRAIHDRYPGYYRFFSTPSFRYAGKFMQNHNHLMEQVEGMDGIKTGYTHLSGFNLLSSVKRNGHWLVAVVLGGKTRLGRDHVMAEIIAAQIDKCATVRTAPVIAENPALEQVAEAIPVIQHEGDSAPPVQSIDEEAAETPAVTMQGDSGDAPAINAISDSEAAPASKTEEAAPAPERHVHPAKAIQSASQATTKVATLAEAPAQPRARPAFVSGLPRWADHDMTATGSIHPRETRSDGSTTRWNGAATATPSTLKHNARHDHVSPAHPVEMASLATKVELPTGRPAAVHGGWMIQIGATPTVAKANDLLERAKGQSHGALSAAHPFTEKVQKGSETLYRARFAGLESGTADAACRNLKRAGISCFATKN